MSEVVGGIFTSHVPAIGQAIARGMQGDPYWKPFFDGFAPVHEWLARKKPDVAVVFYNDHGLNFFLDKMPTFAIGAAAEYRHEDEGWGISGYKAFAGAPDLSWHIIEHVVAAGFDPVTCQKMAVDHGVVVPREFLHHDGKLDRSRHAHDGRVDAAGVLGGLQGTLDELVCDLGVPARRRDRDAQALAVEPGLLWTALAAHSWSSVAETTASYCSSWCSSWPIRSRLVRRYRRFSGFGEIGSGTRSSTRRP